MRRFYCETTPNPILPGHHATEYHRITQTNIRRARYLKDIGREIDIVRDKEFVKSNITFYGFLKSLTKVGCSRPTIHKAVLTDDDLKKSPITCNEMKHLQLF